jgi:hypothetical protein
MNFFYNDLCRRIDWFTYRIADRGIKICGVKPGEAGGDNGEDPEGPKDAFTDRWGWIGAIDGAAETQRCSWDAMLDKPAVEFLNTLAYRADKAAKERADVEKWKRTH